MIFAVAAFCLLIQAVRSGVVSSETATPSRLVAAKAAAPVIASAPVAAAPLLAQPAALASAPLVAHSAALTALPLVAQPAALAAAPLIAHPAPLAAYAKAVPQAVAPYASSVNLVSRSAFLPYVARTSVVSPFVETISAPLVTGKYGSIASAPLVAAPAHFYSAVV